MSQIETIKAAIKSTKTARDAYSKSRYDTVCSYKVRQAKRIEQISRCCLQQVKTIVLYKFITLLGHVYFDDSPLVCPHAC